MNTNKDLSLDDGSTLKWFKKDYKYFLNKTAIIYGRTQSGKSTIIDEIMYMIKSYISIPIVICQSSVTVQSSPYYGKIPNNCIKSNVTKEWLIEFMNTQKGRAAIYKTANDIKTLKSLFDKIKTNDISSIESQMINNANIHINKLHNNPGIDFAEKKSQITAIENIRDENLIKLYKTCIRKNKPELERKTNLTTEEKCCVNYLDFNPNVMLVFDDCAASFKKWVKESEVIKEMFYNGRHYFITQIITAQDDKEIDSELRKNALVSIFTTSQSSGANFNRSSNNYTKADKKLADLCATRVFNSESENSRVKNFKKLVYLQSEAQPFYYTIADLYDDFRIGCDAIWELDEGLDAISGNNNNSNEFFQQYHNI